jgi:class 3 adenylate cyclase
MPIYMDRHFSIDATRTAIKVAHERDLKIQDKHGVKFLTYWFDEDRCTTFCLVDAPNKEAIQEAHDEAHGGVPHEIVEVDPQVVEAFLGRVNDPAPSTASDEIELDSAFRVIMFTDLKDSTLMTTMYGDSKALHLLHIHNALTRNALRAHNGTEVKHTGDGIMASFKSVANSINCALNIQEAFNTHNLANPDEALHVRIGISAGEPIEEEGDLFGSAVQMAARLCSHAEPNQILAAQIVRDQCVDMDQRFVPKDEASMKGFNQKIIFYEVREKNE